MRYVLIFLLMVTISGCANQSSKESLGEYYATQCANAPFNGYELRPDGICHKCTYDYWVRMSNAAKSDADPSINPNWTPYSGQTIWADFPQRLDQYAALCPYHHNDLQKKIASQNKTKENEKIQSREAMINECQEIGFKIKTEGMGNCVLKLMEISSSSNTQSSSSQSGSNSVDQQRLLIEKERLRMEKNKSRQEAADKLLDLGKCYQIFGDFSPYC